MKNVILLTIDTLRRDVLGCYGGGGLTPFIDSIQNQCIRLDRAQPQCPNTGLPFPVSSPFGCRSVPTSHNWAFSKRLKEE